MKILALFLIINLTHYLHERNLLAIVTTLILGAYTIYGATILISSSDAIFIVYFMRKYVNNDVHDTPSD